MLYLIVSVYCTTVFLGFLMAGIHCISVQKALSEAGFDDVLVGLADMWMLFVPGWNVWITVSRIMRYDDELSAVLEALNGDAN